VEEVHALGCALSRDGRRCTCSPTYRARAGRGGGVQRTFATLAEATAWQASVRAALVHGGAPVRPAVAPTLRDAAVSFVHRATRGDALTRSRCRYAPATVDGYERALSGHVLEARDPRSGLELGQLRCDMLDGRSLQALVDGIAARESPAVARVAAAALYAVLRDLYGRGMLDALPPRLALPPPPRARDAAFTPSEGERLLAAAHADDATHKRWLMAPLVALLLGTGARLSELLALDWGPAGLDLDAKPPIARIARAKTEAGLRSVPLAAEHAAILRRHRLASGRPPDGTPVFADEHGRRLDRHGRVRAGLRRTAKTAGVEASAHVYRHAHTTWLLAAGVPAAVAAARLGHADGGALLHRVYAHPGEADQLAALQTLERFQRRAKPLRVTSE
jgi:integrase